MGHFGPTQVKMAIQTLQMVNMELERQKMQGCVNTEAFLDCLNKYVAFSSFNGIHYRSRPFGLIQQLIYRMLEPLAIVKGMMGLRTWLTEVQYLMTRLKQRSFGGMPLYVFSSSSSSSSSFLLFSIFLQKHLCLPVVDSWMIADI